MSNPNIDINVSGPIQASSTYKTVILKGNHSFASQVTESNTKYVIRWNFDLDGEEVEIPSGSILQFDGGSLRNGTVVCNRTLLDGNVILGLDVNLQGRIQNREILFNWFGAVGDEVTDNILPIQKAIDTCATLEAINTVSASDGRYLISKPINLTTKANGIHRHNINIKGKSFSYMGVAKGLAIIGNTGSAIIECIDSVNVVLENISLFSKHTGDNPSTVGVAVARGEIRYVPKFTMRNCFINVAYASTTSKTYNGGFGSIGLYINDAEESIFDNVEILANCALAIANQNRAMYYETDANRLPETRKMFSYTSFYGKELVSISNTVYRFNNCRFCSRGKVSPVIAIASTSSVYMKGCFSQNSLWFNSETGEPEGNGTCNYGMFFEALRNSFIENTLEGYGTAFVFSSTIENSEIRVNLDGRYNNGNGDTGEDNTGLIYFLEPNAAYRNCWNNNISIQCNNENSPILNCRRSYVAIDCLTRFINSNIYSNVKNQIIIPAFASLYRGNNLFLQDASYCDVGSSYFKLLTDHLNFGKIDDNKYYKVWEYVIGNGRACENGINEHIDAVLSLTSGGENSNSPSPMNYILNVSCDIYNTTQHTTPSFSVIYSFKPIDENYHYQGHSIRQVEPFVVYDNSARKVVCFIKVTRREPANDMWVMASQEIVYRGSNTKPDKQIIVAATEALDSLSSYSNGTRKDRFKSSSTADRPLVAKGVSVFDQTLGQPVWWTDDTSVGENGWVDCLGHSPNVRKSGTFAQKPTTGLYTGFQYFNTDTHKMITWDDIKWYNPDGTEATE